MYYPIYGFTGNPDQLNTFSNPGTLPECSYCCILHGTELKGTADINVPLDLSSFGGCCGRSAAYDTLSRCHELNFPSSSTWSRHQNRGRALQASLFANIRQRSTSGTVLAEYGIHDPSVPFTLFQAACFPWAAMGDMLQLGWARVEGQIWDEEETSRMSVTFSTAW